MKKHKIVFAVIFTVSVGLAIVAACLGNPIQSLLISVLSVLYLVCFILSVIEDHLSKIVSLLEIRTLGHTLDILAFPTAFFASACACCKPRSVKGTSVRPLTLFSTFHAVSPCRAM